jgi:uncharacterized membrane protein YqjE
VRLFWLLPKAAPVLLRHIAAYAELAGLDLARAQREVSAHVMALALVFIAVFFALLMGCLLLIAWTWDTPYRVSAIAWLGGGFLVVALAAVVYRSNLIRSHSPLFSSLRREWHEDAVLLEHLLSSEQD